MRRSDEWRQQVALGLIMLVVGVVCIRLALTGEYASLVKASMRPWLWLAGAVVTGMAGWTLVRQGRDRRAGHDVHGGIASIGALLLLPMLVLLTVPTPSSGLYLAKRQTSTGGAGTSQLAPLPDGDVVGIRLDDYVIRSVFRDPAPMKGRTFRVVGFVANTPDAQGWSLARMKVSCCVADALTYRVETVGAKPLADGTWVEVRGEYLPAVDRQARIKVLEVTPVPVPEQPLLA